MQKIHQRGIATLFIILLVAVLGGAGGVGYYVWQKYKDDQDSGHCAPGQTYGIPPLPDAHKKVCMTPGVLVKPAIYLYPTSSQQVNVKVSTRSGLIKTDPLYNQRTGWDVSAEPNGRLTNLSDGKTYPYLFWEGNPSGVNYDLSSGFVVASGDTQRFLDKQLKTIGLNTAEIKEFTDFWVPRMQDVNYNLIHFAGNEYTDYAKLSITPKPDSVLRVFMVVKSLEQPVKTAPQTFPTFERNGFTVVEWGGTQIL